MYPRIFLAMDNCVLKKRWTEPDEWARIMRDLGVRYVEASADTELDPLYMGRAYVASWASRVAEAEARHGVRVSSVYSGHGSYTTLGIAHPDASVRDNIVENFVFPLVDIAGKLGCGLGFFAHAFRQADLQSPELYSRQVDVLVESLVRINRRSAEAGCQRIGIEKMYTPHQYPWRNDDVRRLLRRVRDASGRDFYFTEDVGHHNPKFRMPCLEDLSGDCRDVWLGTDRAAAMVERGCPEEALDEMRRNPQLFLEDDEGDCYETLRELGCFSPIIHLQQTDGVTSGHRPFTEAENRRGIIRPRRFLKALRESYERPVEDGMPLRCTEIYLTLELFSSTTSIMRDVLRDCAESVEYWRRFIPEDGISLEEIAS